MVVSVAANSDVESEVRSVLEKLVDTVTKSDIDSSPSLTLPSISKGKRLSRGTPPSATCVAQKKVMKRITQKSFNSSFKGERTHI